MGRLISSEGCKATAKLMNPMRPNGITGPSAAVGRRCGVAEFSAGIFTLSGGL